MHLKSFKESNIVSHRKTISGNNVGLGTTLFENKVRPKTKPKKRRVIPDKDITPSLFTKLKNKCLSRGYELKQKDIIEELYDLNISNITMARVINDLIPTARATQASVASMIRFLKNRKNNNSMVEELDKILDEFL